MSQRYSMKAKKAGLVVASLLLLLLIAYGIINYLANQKLPELLGEDIRVGTAHISLFGNDIDFRKLEFHLDSTSQNIQIDATAHSINIHGFSLWDLLVHNKIEVEQLLLDSPDVEVQLPSFKTSTEQKKKINLFIRKIFTRIEVEHFELKNGHVRVLKKEDQSRLFELGGFQLSANDIVVDTATVSHIFPLRFDQGILGMDSVFLQAGSGYVMRGKKVHIKDTTVTVNQLTFKSTFSREEFVREHRYEKAQIDLSVEQMVIKTLLWNIRESKRLSFRSPHAAIRGLHLLVFKDKHPPQPPPEHKPLLTEILRNLPFQISLDTLTLEDSDIIYEQQPVVPPNTGQVSFNDFYMTGYHVSNDSGYLQEDLKTVLDVSCMFMNKGKLTTTFRLDVRSTNEEFSVNGELGPMPFHELNQVLTPLVRVQARGDVHAMTFDFSGDEYDAQGNLTFRYSSLKVTAVDTSNEKQWLKTIFGNVALRNQNIPGQNSYQKGDIYFIRYQNKDFFNYFWNCLRVGLMDVVVPFVPNPDEANPPKHPKHKPEED